MLNDWRGGKPRPDDA